MFSKEISFPMYPTKADIKKPRKEVAYDTFEVVDGGKAKDKPSRAGTDKAEPGGKEN
jgi:hypothetical protein